MKTHVMWFYQPGPKHITNSEKFCENDLQKIKISYNIVI